MNFWNQFPDADQLSKTGLGKMQIHDVNGHLHTPYSFSAFEDIEQVFELNKIENVKVLGINDFFATNGYEDWAMHCLKYKVFPLFNIEFIGLSELDQKNGLRINDPGNPGRIYMSGKGMSFPFKLDASYAKELELLQQKSNMQSDTMCELLNNHLKEIGVEFNLSYIKIKDDYTKGMVRERHLAKALRIKVFENATTEKDRKDIFDKIFSGNSVQSDLNNHAKIENEIRSKLLKAGGVAFVQESSDMFLSFEKTKEIILNGGGIPTYPLLADSVNGGYTEFEENKEKLLANLIEKGIYSVEFIPNRNTLSALEEYADFFVKNGIIVTFGSEHNTPELIPLKLATIENFELSDKLKEINYNGACMIAAHQYLIAKNGEGVLNDKGELIVKRSNEYVKLGNNLIKHLLNI